MFDANDYFPGFAAAQRAYENEEPEYYDVDDGGIMSEEEEREFVALLSTQDDKEYELPEEEKRLISLLLSGK